MKVEHQPWTFPTFWFIKLIDQKYAYNYRWTCNYIILNNLKKILQTFQLGLVNKVLVLHKIHKIFWMKNKSFPVKRKAVLLSARIHYTLAITLSQVCNWWPLEKFAKASVLSLFVIVELPAKLYIYLHKVS